MQASEHEASEELLDGVSVELAPVSTLAEIVRDPVARDPVASNSGAFAGPPVRAVVTAEPVARDPVARDPLRAKPAPTPVTTPAPAVKERSLAAEYAEGVAAFGAGDHVRASRLWREMLAEVDPDYATIQIAINCAFDNVIKNQQALAGSTSFYALVYRHDGRDCHLSLTGLYRTRDDATLAIAGLPAEIREQKPRAVTMRELWSRVAAAVSQGVQRHGTR